MDEENVLKLHEKVQKTKDQIKAKIGKKKKYKDYKSPVFKLGEAFALGSSLGGKFVASSSTLTSLELAWSRELVVVARLSLMELKSTSGKFSIASILKSSKPAA